MNKHIQCTNSLGIGFELSELKLFESKMNFNALKLIDEGFRAAGVDRHKGPYTSDYISTSASTDDSSRPAVEESFPLSDAPAFRYPKDFDGVCCSDPSGLPFPKGVRLLANRFLPLPSSALHSEASCFLFYRWRSGSNFQEQTNGHKCAAIDFSTADYQQQDESRTE